MTKSLIVCAALVLAGCAGSGQYGDSDDTLTVGKVQREVRIGMPGGQVAEVLGSPNIVSTDEDRNEVWIYDRFSTTYIHSDVRAGILSIGGGSDVIGGVSVGGGQRSGATTQKTLTILIKFDEDQRVRDFAYHASRF